VRRREWRPCQPSPYRQLRFLTPSLPQRGAVFSLHVASPEQGSSLSVQGNAVQILPGFIRYTCSCKMYLALTRRIRLWPCYRLLVS